jgi:hypothetical protein
MIAMTKVITTSNADKMAETAISVADRCATRPPMTVRRTGKPSRNKTARLSGTLSSIRTATSSAITGQATSAQNQNAAPGGTLGEGTRPGIYSDYTASRTARARASACPRRVSIARSA